MLIYFTQNLINGKAYIGKDTTEDPKYYGSGTAFKHALKKYGKKNFKKYVLIADIKTEKEINQWERFYTDLFCADTSDNFYNLVPGGQGYATKEIYQFDKQGNFLKKFASLELAAKECNILNKGNISLVAEGKRNVTGGFRWSYTDIPNSIVQHKIGRKQGTKNSWKIERNHVNIFTVPLECYENDVLINKFNNQQEAADYFNVSKENINQAIIRNQKGKLFKKKYRFIKGIKKQITQIINNE